MNGADNGGVQGACPTGWHLPTDQEWKDMEMSLSGMSQADADATGWRGTDEGSKLAAVDAMWSAGALNPNNSSGFSALPGGFRNYDGVFMHKNSGCLLWSSTQSASGTAYYRYLYSNNANVGRTINTKSIGFSIRCVEGAGVTPLYDGDVSTMNDARDSKTYNTIVIGGKEWMSENLAYLPSVNALADGSEDAGQETAKKYYVYGYDGTNVTTAKAQANYSTYGVLYNWYAAMDSNSDASSSNNSPSGVQGACPSGWHLPSDLEWKEMQLAIGMSQAEVDATGFRGTLAGTLAKPGLWNAGGLNPTNTTGFAALPAGYRNTNGVANVGNNGLWWSSTQSSATDAWRYYLYFGLAGVERTTNSKAASFSVRCIKN
jgi:uncharacterized protein (TIGR02145 family)